LEKIAVAAWPYVLMKARRTAEIKKIPCIFPVYRELGGGDRFVSDCAHRQQAIDITEIIALQLSRNDHHSLRGLAHDRCQEIA
jgi:hypothetical protein